MIHLEAGADAMSRLADQMRDRAAEFDFGRGVRPIARLVLQPLNLQAIARAVRQPAGDDEARHAFLGLRQRQEHVGMRNGEEPFVPDKRIRAVAVRLGTRLRLAHI